MTHDTTLGGQTVEGTPAEIGCEISRLVIIPAASQLAACHDTACVVAFYTALVTHVLCSVAIIFDTDTARRIAAAAVGQIDEAAATAAALAASVHPGMH